MKRAAEVSIYVAVRFRRWWTKLSFARGVFLLSMLTALLLTAVAPYRMR
jgi:hypothetical protein